MDLHGFLKRQTLRSAWVSHDGMNVFVRRAVHGVIISGAHVVLQTLDVANVENPFPERRGKGQFWGLITYLLDNPLPDREGLYVECVQNDRLAVSLPQHGFVLATSPGELPGCPPSFYRPYNGALNAK